MFQKIVLGGATVAAMSTGQVQAAENSAPMENPDATRTETVVTPKDTITNSDNVLDLSNEFLTSQFTSSAQEVKTPCTIEDLQKLLDDPTNLNSEQNNMLNLWSEYIISNPQDENSKTAFGIIKQKALETTNKWVWYDQYYGSTQCSGTPQALEDAKEILAKSMNKMLASDDVIKNIPEAYVEGLRLNDPARDFATMRCRTQLELLEQISKNKVNELANQYYKGNKKEKQDAQETVRIFYEQYGINLISCHKRTAKDDIYQELPFVKNQDVKDAADAYVLHTNMDIFFSKKNNAVIVPNLAYVDGNTYNIDYDVSQCIRAFAAIEAKYQRGEKLSKNEENMKFGANFKIEEALNAYYGQCTQKFTKEMNKPKGDYLGIQYRTTNNLVDEDASKYIRLLRLGEDYTITGQNQMTDNDIVTIAEIEQRRPDLRQAREGYEVSLEKQKQYFAEAMNRPEGENITFYNRSGLANIEISQSYGSIGIRHTPVDQEATTYINLLRLGEDKLTDENRATIAKIEHDRPDLGIARRAYYNEQQTQQKSLQLSASDFMTR